MHVLIAAADPHLGTEMRATLINAGHDVTVVRTAEAALAALAHAPHLLLASWQLPDKGGIELIAAARAIRPGLDVVLVGALDGVEDAASAMRAGAADLIQPPVDAEVLERLVREIAQRRQAHREFTTATANTALPIDSTMLRGRSQAMQILQQRLERIAASHASVLIRGESGTGKELVARWLHQRSPRGGGPFVVVHCAALPETLLEAELFGHARGAFTGAVKARRGRFVVASGGTLFLDEVGEIPLPVQAKLLRVLQDGVVQPLGTEETHTVDVRILSATHRDLKSMIADGRFREDLYYRLKVVDAQVPPLRARREDIAPLVDHFRHRFAGPLGPPEIQPAALAALSSYDFPGNVRELEHAVQHAIVFAGTDPIDLAHLPTEILEGFALPDAQDSGFLPLADAVRDFEQSYLERALALTDGNKTRAAALLGISRKNLWEKLKRTE